MNVVVKIVQLPVEPRLMCPVDFNARDAEEWGRYAVKGNTWKVACEIGAPSFGTYDIETAACIAAPNGRVAVWYGRAPTIAPTMPRSKGFHRRRVSCHAAALVTLKCRAAAALFDDRCTRGGERDVTQLAMAACRVLHAQAFEYEPAPRDRLVAAFAALVGAERPPTAHIIKASDMALLAASALLDIENYQAARALLAGRGVCGL